jgi:hypothetical protein
MKGRRQTEGVSVVVGVLDEGLENVFYSSTAVLGQQPLTLRPGQTATVEVSLQMHLATGTFHMAAWLHNAAMDRSIDEVIPAATFVVSAEPDVRGSANLYPAMHAVHLSD